MQLRLLKHSLIAGSVLALVAAPMLNGAPALAGKRFTGCAQFTPHVVPHTAPRTYHWLGSSCSGSGLTSDPLSWYDDGDSTFGVPTSIDTAIFVDECAFCTSTVSNRNDDETDFTLDVDTLIFENRGGGAPTTSYTIEGGPVRVENHLEELSNYNQTINVPVTGPGDMTKSGNGWLYLNGQNSTFSGGTTVNNGVAVAMQSTALGTGSVTLDSGSLSMAGNNLDIPNPLVFSGSGGAVIDVFSDSGVSNEFSGSISIGDSVPATLLSGSTSTLTFSGAITGSNFTVGDGSSDGLVRLTNAGNTLSGTTAVLDNGQVDLGGTGTLHDVALGANAWLKGGGTVHAVTASGSGGDHIAPGLQTLTAASVSVGHGSEIDVAISGATIGTIVTGTGIDLSGWNLVASSSGTPTGHPLTVVSGPLVSDHQFDNAADDSTVIIDGVSFVVHYNYGDNPQTVTLTAPKSTPTSITLSVSPNPGTAGQPLTLTATVIGTDPWDCPTGLVTFYDGSSAVGTAPLVGDPVATLIIADPTSGVHHFRATYAGDAVYAGIAMDSTVDETVDAAIPLVPDVGGRLNTMSVWLVGVGTLMLLLSRRRAKESSGLQSV